LSADYSQQVAETLLAELGLQKSQVRELQTIPVDRLSGAAADAIRKTPQPQTAHRDSFGENGWGPTVDGHSLPNHPFDPAAPAISTDVPLITGTNLNESINALDHPDANAMTTEEMERRVHDMFESDASAIIAAYKEDYPHATPFSLYATITAAQWRIPAFTQAARKAALGGASVYSYIYSWGTPVLDNRPGTFHACEISFAFDNAEICDHYSAGDPAALILSKQMSSAWVSFARTGNPNHSELPFWPNYTQDNRATMYFDAPCFVSNNPEGKGLKIIMQSRSS
jgi:para-nitrobenzyl esterase